VAAVVKGAPARRQREETPGGRDAMTSVIEPLVTDLAVPLRAE
jgi:hypothetical protein